MPLVPGGIYLPSIIASASVAAAATSTQGYAAAAAASPSVAVSFAARMLSPLKLIYLRFICRVATNYEIPQI